MRLSDLQAKMVVNIKDGKHLGTIIDAELNENGQILYFSVMVKRILKKFFKSEPEVNITFNQIVKIGTDVILVEL